jgi:hypothetical protein
MNVKLVFYFLILFSLIIFANIWYIGFEPEDFNSGRDIVKSVIEDSCSYGDTVFFREGKWMGLEKIEKGQLYCSHLRELI